MRYSVNRPRVGNATEGECDGAEAEPALPSSSEKSAVVLGAPVSIPRPRPSERPAARKSGIPPAPSASRATKPAVPSRTAAGSPDRKPDALEDADLVITVAPSDWNLPSRDALVGHQAVRVAIAPGRGPGGTLMIRPLEAGEVAPRGSTIAVLVTLALQTAR
jgi:hypothetical protein